MADQEGRVQNCRVTRILLEHLSPEQATILFVKLHNALPEEERKPLADYLNNVHVELKREQDEFSNRREERWSDE